jgi:hypothetical protein
MKGIESVLERIADKTSVALAEDRNVSQELRIQHDVPHYGTLDLPPFNRSG